MRLLDARFKWVPAVATDVRETWRRFGYRPITPEEREARQHPPGVYAPKPSIESQPSIEARTEQMTRGESRASPPQR